MDFKRAAYQSPGEPGKRGFEDLDCFRLSLDVVVNAHHFAQSLPSEEKYDLASQIRRSSKSVTANIAEGYGRYHYLDSLKFFSIARGSLNETLGHLINGRVLGYLDQAFFDQVYLLIRSAEKSLNGYMNYVRKQKAGSDLYGERELREEPVPYDPDTHRPLPTASMASS